jgi:hypothetical protein
LVIPQEVRDFISAHIASVEQLEVLLLLRREASRSWTGAEVARELRLNAESTTARLEDLHARGLIEHEGSGSYRFSRDGSVIRVVGELARSYADARVSVINLIFSKPVDKLRSFADAFKFRGGKS